MICQRNPADFTGIVHRNEGQNACLYIPFRRSETAVTKAVSAFVGIQLCSGRLPSGIPDAFAILNIEVLAVIIIGNVVVTITCKPQKLCILIESIAAAGVGDQ